MDNALLIVEDDVEFRSTLVLILKKYFSTIDVAGSLEKAISLLNNRNYAIVITDGIFPKVGEYKITHPNKEDKNGITVANKAKRNGIYVIGMSSEPKVLGDIPDIVLKKPINLTDLQDIIKKQLGVS